MNRQLPYPDQHLKKHFLSHMEIPQINEKFREELKWMNSYGELIHNLREIDIAKINAKVMQLVHYSLKGDKAEVSKWMATYLRVEDDDLQLNIDKIIND